MDHQEIRAVHSLLHLIYHRNKNQHQRAKWWKWLSLLKRTALDLGSTDSINGVSVHRQHLALHLVPRCYLAFSTVVADNQFATLGIVLLAALARLTRASGVEMGLDAKAHSVTKQASGLTSIEEDRGERIPRKQAASLGEPNDAALSKSAARFVEKDYKDRRKKKPSKRKKDAIDDLFSGLM